MEENKTARYFRYAIGEIALVVIGILIALQVNNWNANRIQRIEEQKLLEQVKNEFLKNNRQVLDKILLRKKALESAQRLLLLLDTKGTGQDAAKVDSLLASTIPILTFDPLNGVMSQLIQAG